MKSKKAMSYYVLISLIIGLLVLISYSFFSKGMVFNFLDNVGIVEDDMDQSVDCIVKPGTNGDEDGDGVKDSEECDAVRKGEFFKNE
ncbi:MAG: hypothetical protein ACQESF_00235 [Nanobdellota archaeon]